jgi:NAD(P)-dependent dehydrogenase (short-subunit alcohol dehydrogenase family)
VAGDGTSRAVLITGCSSGIGHATALRLADRGFTVYAGARDPATLGALVQVGCRPLALDVTDDASARAAVATVEHQEGAVGALVNNAGYGQSGAVEAVPIQAVRAQFETNLLGYVRMAQLVLPGMRRQGYGRIVNLSSVAGRVTMPGNGVYSASKFAIRAFNDALRFEVRGFGVGVSLIEPGPIRSGFTARANDGMPPLGDLPYGEYQAAVAKADAETDESFLAGDPEAVARAIERALSARRPRPRYRVTFVSRLLPALRGLLPDRGWDAFLRTQAPPPGADG